jgi:hypothetical protein
VHDAPRSVDGFAVGVVSFLTRSMTNVAKLQPLELEPRLELAVSLTLDPEIEVSLVSLVPLKLTLELSLTLAVPLTLSLEE